MVHTIVRNQEDSVKINDNKNMDVQAFIDKVTGLKREDYAVPSRTAHIDADAIEFGDFRFNMTDHARQQLHARYDGFPSYARAISVRHPDLYGHNINTLLGRDDRKMQVRTIQPNGERIARAVVSDAFKPIDDDLILPDVLGVFGDHGGEWRAIGGQLTPTKSYMNLVTRTPITTIGKREIFAAVQYSNSEVGNGYAQFRAGFIDGYCLNGCWFGTMVIASCQFRHVGSRIQTDFGLIFEERIRAVEMANIRSVVLDASKLAVSGAFVPEMKKLIEDATDKIDASDKAKFIKLIGEKVGLTRAEQENSLVHFEGDLTKYNIQAAITRLAQDAGTYDDRIRLEEAGGKVIQMPDRITKSIMALA